MCATAAGIVLAVATVVGTVAVEFAAVSAVVVGESIVALLESMLTDLPVSKLSAAVIFEIELSAELQRWSSTPADDLY